MAISELERYKRVCARIDAYERRHDATFSRFIQLSLATIGGFFWLKTQSSTAGLTQLFDFGRWILPGLAVIMILETAIDLYGWFGFRIKEAELVGDERVRPKFPRSGRSELFRMVMMAAVGGAGYVLLR